MRFLIAGVLLATALTAQLPENEAAGNPEAPDRSHTVTSFYPDGRARVTFLWADQWASQVLRPRLGEYVVERRKDNSPWIERYRGRLLFAKAAGRAFHFWEDDGPFELGSVYEWRFRRIGCLGTCVSRATSPLGHLAVLDDRKSEEDTIGRFGYHAFRPDHRQNESDLTEVGATVWPVSGGSWSGDGMVPSSVRARVHWVCGQWGMGQADMMRLMIREQGEPWRLHGVYDCDPGASSPRRVLYDYGEHGRHVVYLPLKKARTYKIRLRGSIRHRVGTGDDGAPLHEVLTSDSPIWTIQTPP
ncbi:MAG: hypothetical protein OXF62_17855 [Caldilineaceae bacterium]|nr:hypothetical protein [Caldilineaceae bacterium]